MYSTSLWPVAVGLGHSTWSFNLYFCRAFISWIIHTLRLVAGVEKGSLAGETDPAHSLDAVRCDPAPQVFCKSDEHPFAIYTVVRGPQFSDHLPTNLSVMNECNTVIMRQLPRACTAQNPNHKIRFRPSHLSKNLQPYFLVSYRIESLPVPRTPNLQSPEA